MYVPLLFTFIMTWLAPCLDPSFEQILDLTADMSFVNTFISVKVSYKNGGAEEKDLEQEFGDTHGSARPRDKVAHRARQP